MNWFYNMFSQYHPLTALSFSQQQGTKQRVSRILIICLCSPRPTALVLLLRFFFHQHTVDQSASCEKATSVVDDVDVTLRWYLPHIPVLLTTDRQTLLQSICSFYLFSPRHETNCPWGYPPPKLEILKCLLSILITLTMPGSQVVLQGCVQRTEVMRRWWWLSQQEHKPECG